ncbi:MAG TPA: hypothetical protein V6D14_23070 [Coleofasciculaceae cyanobacterium]|jgi:hypothetical protein
MAVEIVANGLDTPIQMLIILIDSLMEPILFLLYEEYVNKGKREE